jgi:ribosomal protein L32
MSGQRLALLQRSNITHEHCGQVQAAAAPHHICLAALTNEDKEEAKDERQPLHVVTQR